MLFNSFQYWIFLLIVAVLFYSTPFRFGKILLVLASYVFYMWWDPLPGDLARDCNRPPQEASANR